MGPLLAIVGLFSGIIFWVTLMPLLIHSMRHRLPQRAIRIISLLSAAILSFFGLSMLWQTFMA